MCNYKTRLAKNISLDVNDWEVGLAELIYPHSWNNITDGKFRVKNIENDRWVWKECEIPSALYETPQQLVNTLNLYKDRILTDAQRGKVVFYYNTLLRKFMAFVAQGYMVRFNKHLAIALGLGDIEITLRQSKNEEDFGVVEKNTRLVYDDDKIIATMCMDLKRGLHTFFIYCDIVEYQLVGDANVPLLRTVPVSGKNGDVVANSFDNVHYVPLSRSTFQDIEVHITDDTGLRVPFEQGRVIVKLHFKKK